LKAPVGYRDIFKRALSAFFYGRCALVEQTVEFEFAVEHFIGFDAHDS
jgi:hypothetical protein